MLKHGLMPLDWLCKMLEEIAESKPRKKFTLESEEKKKGKEGGRGETLGNAGLFYNTDLL